ncbi:MAG: peptide MFS transporter [Planctomycetes bacterium]|nr:peptide MFS transporter [Planctomycetota bacterium]
MNDAAEKHPKALYVLFSTEMWERFSFYSVGGMLLLYLTNYFKWSEPDAIVFVNWYTALVYASPLIGGWLADRFLGYRKSVYIGGAFFIAGHTLFAGGTLAYTYAALACLIIGNGFFKPNVSTMVGNLYSTGSKLKDRAFSIFYTGINIGAMLGPIACEILREKFKDNSQQGFDRAFNAAAFGMVLAMIIFTVFRSAIPERAANPSRVASTEPTEHHPVDDVPEWKRVVALTLVCAVGVVFWILFWQSNTTLTLWAEHNTDWNVSGIISNAINPGFIIIFGFLLSFFFKYLAKRGLEPSTPAKMTFGLFFASLATAILFVAATVGGNTGKVSPTWLFAAYACISVGEILLSAMGLSLVSKVAPPRFRGVLMGGWFLSISIGAKFADIGQYWAQWSHSYFFAVLTGMALAGTLVLFLMLRFLRKSMPGI